MYHEHALWLSRIALCNYLQSSTRRVCYWLDDYRPTSARSATWRRRRMMTSRTTMTSRPRDLYPAVPVGVISTICTDTFSALPYRPVRGPYNSRLFAC